MFEDRSWRARVVRVAVLVEMVLCGEVARSVGCRASGVSFMVRIARLTIPSLVFAAACAACSSASKPHDPGDPGGGPPPGDPKGPGTTSPGTSNERPEVSLGMTIMARDAAGAPRLVRAIRPRAMAA